MMTVATKPHLSLLRIIEMNLGFLGLQFSFGLQQSNMSPIYSYLGANEAGRRAAATVRHRIVSRDRHRKSGEPLRGHKFIPWVII
eukprot:gene12151-16216_t